MPVTMSPLRYPGGKTKLYPVIAPLILKTVDKNRTYVEPFAGGAGLALKLLLNGDVSNIVLNDIDENIYLFWKACLNNNDELCTLVHSTVPSIAEWDKQREIFLHPTGHSEVERAFATLYLNRYNISGVIFGGPIGGRKQEGKYLIDARYNARELIKKLRVIGEKRSQIAFYNLEASVFLRDIVAKLSQSTSFVNIDPPYVKKGPLLYRNCFTETDHRNLSKVIQGLQHHWILTYDECDLVHTLYQNFRQIPLCLSYSAGYAKKGNELLILGPSIQQ